MDKTIDKIVRHADYSEKAIERYFNSSLIIQ